MFEDCGYEGNGIVQFCHCENCGAEIEYRIPLDDEESEDNAGEHTDNGDQGRDTAASE